MLISSPRIPTPISATTSIIAFAYGIIMVFCTSPARRILGTGSRALLRDLSTRAEAAAGACRTRLSGIRERDGPQTLVSRPAAVMKIGAATKRLTTTEETTLLNRHQF